MKLESKIPKKSSYRYRSPKLLATVTINLPSIPSMFPTLIAAVTLAPVDIPNSGNFSNDCCICLFYTLTGKNPLFSGQSSGHCNCFIRMHFNNAVVKFCVQNRRDYSSTHSLNSKYYNIFMQCCKTANRNFVESWGSPAKHG